MTKRTQKKRYKKDSKRKCKPAFSVSDLHTTKLENATHIAWKMLDLDEAIRGHLGRKELSAKTAEGAKLWFQVLEQMRTNEALLKEQLRKILNYPKGTL